jgi:hypothetical protein
MSPKTSKSIHSIKSYDRFYADGVNGLIRDSTEINESAL